MKNFYVVMSGDDPLSVHCTMDRAYESLRDLRESENHGHSAEWRRDLRIEVAPRVPMNENVVLRFTSADKCVVTEEKNLREAPLEIARITKREAPRWYRLKSMRWTADYEEMDD